MVLPVNIQIYYFLSTLVAGVTTGIFFDIYRVIRGFNNPNKFITALSDVLFWILAGIIIFIFFLYFNNGDMGYYTFLGILMGILIYFIALSNKFIKGLTVFIYFIFKFIRIIIISIVYPIKLVRYMLRCILYKFKYIMIIYTKKARHKLNLIKVKNKEG